MFDTEKCHNKDEKLDHTKKKLLDSTTLLMEEMDDPVKVTSREIAGKAGVKAAMIARECGIPAVVGCGNATTLLHTGDEVIVDGGAGTVTVV